MRKLLGVAVLVAAMGLGACQGAIQKFETAWSVVTQAQVSPTQIVVAGNAFDAAEATATQYLIWCKANKTNAACALSTRQKVVAGVRAGRAARNQLEPYVVSGSAGPSALYNTLITAINTLTTTTPKVGASQ